MYNDVSWNTGEEVLGAIKSLSVYRPGSMNDRVTILAKPHPPLC